MSNSEKLALQLLQNPSINRIVVVVVVMFHSSHYPSREANCMNVLTGCTCFIIHPKGAVVCSRILQYSLGFIALPNVAFAL
mgnify:CR=1 FL=1